MNYVDKLNKYKSPVHEYYCEALDAVVYFKQITAAQRSEITASGQTEVRPDGTMVLTKGSQDTGVLMLLYSLCDENGDRVYSEKDKKALNEMPVTLAQELLDQATAFNFPNSEKKRR